ncbi:hypothetical protein RAD15_07880 [Bradyrhizobium sp. 14AA]
MRHLMASNRLKTLVVALIGMLMLSVPAPGQDRMVLGSRQFEVDKSGNGAVLCAWSMYLSIQAETAACGLTRRQTDDAMDEAIAAIDEFILANSSLHPTRAMLDEFKQRAAESHLGLARRQGLQNFCSRPDLEHFRSISPDQIRAGVKKLLEIPREPVMNPCL